MLQGVNTVVGPVSSDRLGQTLMHEHFVFGHPGFQGDLTLGEYDRENAIKDGIKTAKKLLSTGIKTVVDPTPNECGRDPELLQVISLETGLQIICATGYYYEKGSASAYFKFRSGLYDLENEIFEMFMQEITGGIGKTGIKAGVIKVASGLGQISKYEEAFFKAAAKAQLETGVPIITHTQQGTMGPEQAELLLKAGADPRKCLIGHMCGNTDMTYHLRTLALGFYIGFDRFGLDGFGSAPTDEMRISVLAGLIEKGYGKRILLAHDSVNFWLGRPLKEFMEKLLPNWQPTHIFENILPLLKARGISAEQINHIFDSNPQRLFNPNDGNSLK